MEGADAVFPACASALARGRRLRRAAAPGAGAQARVRRKTMPVTFAEIKEVDEESAELGSVVSECGDRAAGAGGVERRRRPDVMEERLGAAARLRRARDPRALRELSPPARCSGSGELTRAGSEPAALHRDTEALVDCDT